MEGKICPRKSLFLPTSFDPYAWGSGTSHILNFDKSHCFVAAKTRTYWRSSLKDI